MSAADEHDVISVDTAVTLDGLFRERVARTPDLPAYRYCDAGNTWREYTWAGMYREIARWQNAFERDGMKAGDKVAVMLRNSPEWVMCDIAALGLGLVIVPLYTQDRPENVAYIVNDAECKVLLIESEEQWGSVGHTLERVPGLVRLLTVKSDRTPSEHRVVSLQAWLAAPGAAVRHETTDPHALATIVYTSGTTGRPKGVMLSHRNVLSNVHACLTGVTTTRHEDVFLSFLPLSHTFERTCGYYLPMMAGSTVVYARTIQTLSDDLRQVRPTVLVSVPRIYERVWGAIKSKLDEGPPARRRLFLAAVEIGYARFEHAQGRVPWKPSFLLWPLLRRLVAAPVLERLGGRLRVALSGGAALSAEISRVFIGLGVPVLQGYGMTEASPVVCANRPLDNVPASVGTPVPGVQVKIGDYNALLIKGPNIMLGYWKNPQATQQIMLPDGWLNSGDTARLDEQGHVYITGRLKEIIVMSNGEKVPPVDVESAILEDPLFEQVLLLGEGKPHLTALAVLDAGRWEHVAAEHGVPSASDALGSKKVQDVVLKRMGAQLATFPGYAQVRRVCLTLEPWTVENGMLTPTLKLRRTMVMERFNAEIDRMYVGH